MPQDPYFCLYLHACLLVQSQMQIAWHFNLNVLPRTTVSHGKRFSVSNKWAKLDCFCLTTHGACHVAFNDTQLQVPEDTVRFMEQAWQHFWLGTSSCIAFFSDFHAGPQHCQLHGNARCPGPQPGQVLGETCMFTHATACICTHIHAWSCM